MRCGGAARRARYPGRRVLVQIVRSSQNWLIDGRHFLHPSAIASRAPFLSRIRHQRGPPGPAGIRHAHVAGVIHGKPDPVVQPSLGRFAWGRAGWRITQSIDQGPTALSSYVLAFLHPDAPQSVAELFADHDAEELCVVPDAAPGSGLSLGVAMRGAAQKLRPDGTLFSGMAISHAERWIDFDGHLAMRADSVLDGCHLVCRKDRRRGRECHALWADRFGLLPILHFRTATTFACSDSLAALVALRRRLGLDVSLDEEAYLARLGSWAFYGQQQSTRTIVRDISYALPGTGFLISRAGARIEVDVATPDALRDFPPPRRAADRPRLPRPPMRSAGVSADWPRSPMRLWLSMSPAGRTVAPSVPRWPPGGLVGPG